MMHNADHLSLHQEGSIKKTRRLLSLLVVASLSICLTSTSSINGGILTQVHASPVLPLSPGSPAAPSWTSSSSRIPESRSETEAVAGMGITDNVHEELFKRADPSSSSTGSLEQPIYALIQRLLPPAYQSTFQFKLTPNLVPASATNIHDSFRLSNGGGETIIIEGATLAGLGAGLNHYLRTECQVDMSWSGDRFAEMPEVPPTITENAGTVIRASFVPWRYYMNVVTFGYSFAFWDWKRWERELDWMFLNGVNMALAQIGEEYVFREMYENLGVSRQELNSFFSGPAFMPWQRMGNIQGSWSFPNDTQYKNDWIDSQWELQEQILGRMNDFNITAILPSFNGFVPRELPAKFPSVKFEHASNWDTLGDTLSQVTFVSSTEPFFGNLTERFLQTQNSLYKQKGLISSGSNNYYLLDLYNELRPLCIEVECLKLVTSHVMKSLKSADPKAVWVMQSWFLLQKDIWKPQETKAFFDGIREVNEGKDAFVIDLYSDVMPQWNETMGFFGIEWGWSMLNNFGGSQALYGSLPRLLTEPFRGYQHPAKKMRGMGITMEGINNNEYLYQLIFDIAWESMEANAPSTRNQSAILPGSPALDQPALDGQKHLDDFIKRRYGSQKTSSTVLDSWKTLSQTVWNCSTGQMSQSKSFLTFAPKLEMIRPGFMTTVFWYNQSKVVNAWSQLVASTQTDASRKRRGYGVIQNSVEAVIRSANGGQNTGLIGGGNDGGDNLATLPAEPNERKAALEASFSKRIRDSIRKTVGQNFNEDIEAITESIDITPLKTLAATDSLSEEADLPLTISSFRYDIVDVTREVLAAIVLPGLHKELVSAYKKKDLAGTRSWGRLLLQCVKDADQILSTHSHFMLGPWIRDARLSAKVVSSSSSSNSTLTSNSTLYQNYLEFNARNQVTWWGPAGQKLLADYASKEWGGLVLGFYYPRWQIFVDRLTTAVQKGREFDEKAYMADSLKVETKWQMTVSNGNKSIYPVEAVGDTVEVAQDLWDRWGMVAARFAAKAEK